MTNKQEQKVATANNIFQRFSSKGQELQIFSYKFIFWMNLIIVHLASQYEKIYKKYKIKMNIRYKKTENEI